MITEDGCVLVGPGDGAEVRGASGAQTYIKANGKETHELAAVFEQVTPAKSGPPLHIHRDAAEMFHVLEGTYTFKAGLQLMDAPVGTFVFVPRGVPHTYFNVGEAPARVLFWFVPAAHMSEYFTALAQLPTGPIDRAQLDAIAAQNGVEIVGDPLG